MIMRCNPSFLATVLIALWSMECILGGQVLRIDHFEPDQFAGLISLGWQSRKGEVYSLETSTNLTEWSELENSPLSLMRFSAATGNRIQIEFGMPASEVAHYRLRKVPVIEVATLGAAAGEVVTLKDVNNGARVVGYFESPQGVPTGFTWAPGEDLVTFGLGSTAVAVNEQHTVVGRTYDFDEANYRFFSWTPTGGVVDHGEGSAVDINSSGHILGYEVIPRASNRAFVWNSATGKTYLPHLDPTHGSTFPIAINDAGQVIGDALIEGNYNRAFLWTESGGLVDIVNGQSSAVDINQKGEVIGMRTIQDGTSRAFHWSLSGGMITFPADLDVADINDKGQVVGKRVVNGSNHAFVWSSAAGFLDLAGFSTPGFPQNSQAQRINERGEVVGTSGLVIQSWMVNQAALWKSQNEMKHLEGLSYPSAFAQLINDNGVIFGSARAAGNLAAASVVMWNIADIP